MHKLCLENDGKLKIASFFDFSLKRQMAALCVVSHADNILVARLSSSSKCLPRILDQKIFNHRKHGHYGYGSNQIIMG